MPDAFTISIAGGAFVAPESLGISLQSLTLNNAQTDRLSIGFAMGRDIIEVDTEVSVLRDGVPFFQGRLGLLSWDFSRRAWSGVILGPWEWLEKWPALRNFVAPDATKGIPAWAATSSFLRASFELFSTSSGTGLLNAGAEALRLMAVVEYLQASAHFTVDEMPLGVLPAAPAQVNGNTVADLVRQCDRWMPGLARWVDYSTSPPTFRAREVQELSFGGGLNDAWVAADRTSSPWGVTTSTQSLYEEPITVDVEEDVVACNFTLRTDLLPAGIVYRRDNGAGTNTYQIYPGSTAQDYGVFWADVGTRAEVPAAGLAEYLYASRRPTVMEGQLVLPGLDLRARPGSRWAVVSAPSIPGDYIASAQSVTYDLAAKTTTVALGLPKYLGTGDFLKLQQLVKGGFKGF